ncbi:MAG TPA: M48 family metallopeptidase [Pyrinomonadaceae bacterium]|nr:M48 family metallopeptidase [Pyrinomonadaceae bacterium]
MIQRNKRVSRRFVAWVAAGAILVMPLAAISQTRISAPSNKYSVRDDIQLGQQASQQVQQQMPILNDGYVDDYVESVGRRLVGAIPAEFRQPEFNYTFDVVNARDINAFALPGGPMFVNRGMMEAARTEGEMAGVMAHEISHVALRHATAQATETQKFQIGSVLGQIAGAVIGGLPGAVIGAGSQIGFGAGALKYSRKYETQADILGAQIMARAGYDPRDLAAMFQTIERQGGGRGGPEWLSSHPNPGNRYERINQEAALLRVNSNTAVHDSRNFQNVQARLRGMGAAPTMAEIARTGQRYPTTGTSGDNYPRGERVVYPSSRYRTVSAGNLFSLRVPDNWGEVSSGGNSMTFAPQGAYGTVQGQFVFSHGAMVGVTNGVGNLRQSTESFVNTLLQGNQHLRRQTGFQRVTLDGRQGLATTLAGRSPVFGSTEVVNVYTVMLRDGNLAYIVGVAPENDYRYYQRAFRDIVNSVNINY